MKHYTLLGALLLTACGDAVPVFMLSTRALEPAVAPEMFNEAFGVWGLTWESRDKSVGALEIYMIDMVPDTAWQGQTLAHEIGHAFMLEHDPEPGRVMTSGSTGQEPGWDVTDEQIDAVQRGAEKFGRQCAS